MSPGPFKRDPNAVPDVQTTRGRDVAYKDTSFVVADSPVVLDINTDLGRNGRDGYLVNDGDGELTMEVSDDGEDYGGVHTIKAGEIVRFKGSDIDSIKITWVADSSYRVNIS